MRSKRRELRAQFIEAIASGCANNLSSEAIAEQLLDIAFPEKSLTRQQAMVGALARVMCMDAGLNGGRLAKLAMDVLRAGATPEEIEILYNSDDPKSPWRQDWRGKNGQPPGEKDIRGTLELLRRTVKSKPQDALVIDYK